jgi:glycosyltransferase involved in cell wall biosynthesis
MTLPFGVNTKEFNPEFRLLRNADAPVTVISTRKLDEVYDVETLIRAIPLVIMKYPLVRFRIAGDGPLRQTLEKLAVDLKIRNHLDFMGNVSYEEMPHLLGDSDIFVTASLSDGNNISLNEAIACGAFPVVSDIPANREWVINGQNGLIFPCGNFNSLAEKIIIALQQSELRCTAASKNWSIIEQRGSWIKNMNRIDKYYRSRVVTQE